MFRSLRLSLSKEGEVTVDGWGHLVSLSLPEPLGTRDSAPGAGRDISCWQLVHFLGAHLLMWFPTKNGMAKRVKSFWVCC